MRIGILTSGGDCPGINATLRGVIKSATHHYGMEVVGIKNGFQGLLTGEVMSLEGQAQGLLTLGGTILGTSRCKPFKKDPATGEDQSLQLKRTFIDLGLDCVVCIGGNGTMKTAYKMHRIGIPTIGIPKTIDNDIWGTDCTFGFDTAVSIATEAVDRLHSTASSHGRVMVMEVMGHKAGWIALYSGMAGGADVILIPELDYDLEHVYKAIRDRQAKGKSFTIIVVAEGLKTDGIHRPGEFLSLNVEKTLGLESRYTVLGYVQ
nr:6-phosphofructokinase [Bacteroidaceae bacterium]